MQCPKCHHNDTRVTDSRYRPERNYVSRRRQCEACGFKFSTIEQVKQHVDLAEAAKKLRRIADSLERASGDNITQDQT